MRCSWAPNPGLYRRDASDARGWSLALPAEPVLDLVSAGRELFVATSAGLYTLAPGADTAQRLPLAAGEGVRGLAVDDSGTVWVATAAGLFRRAPGETEFARESGVPSGAIAAVASAGADVWVGVEGELFCGGRGREFQRRIGGDRGRLVRAARRRRRGRGDTARCCERRLAHRPDRRTAGRARHREM